MDTGTRAVAGILGRDGRYRDPLWAADVRLTPLEQRLLRTWPVRRLHFVAHAGAAALTTRQTYSRLEHSLGLLALVARFSPDDEPARIAALLHDVGHLPFSHTFEGIAGLDHHRIGEHLVRELAPILAEYGVDAGEVLAAEAGTRPSVLTGPPGALKLDHLESFLRSGRAHGRLTEPPARTLARLRVADGAVQTDPATARYLARLAFGEADYLTTWENVVATAVLRGLVARMLDADPERAAAVSRMTDDELWAALLTDPRTADHARLLRRDPLGWELRAPAQAHPADGYTYGVRRLYLDTACVGGEPIPFPPEWAARLPELPWECVVAPAE
ncbi:hypothetical protein CLV63_1445 [Murinocardiopsis flavida]|uniref:HD domain-containing protein n=1 Tax=Murinocardiopsis flavida TaxID=645275 RepID=A0A2P8CAW4_9ACTN|nr:HD domain-containing protein [Murinocardiopsis flavida]PSK82111.1 hypothetical protein CLV63_1445 [Murinocardiopsis flavida]